MLGRLAHLDVMPDGTVDMPPGAVVIEVEVASPDGLMQGTRPVGLWVWVSLTPSSLPAPPTQTEVA